MAKTKTTKKTTAKANTERVRDYYVSLVLTLASQQVQASVVRIPLRRDPRALTVSERAECVTEILTSLGFGREDLSAEEPDAIRWALFDSAAEAIAANAAVRQIALACGLSEVVLH